MLFLSKNKTMAHDHKEAEENEIAGPVVVAVAIFALIVIIISFLA